MIVVINATAESAQLHGLNCDLPMPLIPLCDRPFLQHVIEHLLESGARRFEVILSHLPYVVESYFGDGTRWGCQIRYHLVGPKLDPNPHIEQIVLMAEEPVLLGTSDFLPYLGSQSVKEAVTAERPTVFLCGLHEQTGWALMPGGATGISFLRNLPGAPTRQVQVSEALDIRTGEGLLQSQQKILDGSFPEIHLTGRQSQPGVWISRGATIDSSATLVAPVYLGLNCKVEAGAHIGPCAVIGSNSIVGVQSTVANSMICSGTYIGEGLELDHVIVNQHHLIDLQVGTSLSAPEPFFFSGLADHRISLRLRNGIDRVVAAFLFCLLIPLTLIFGLCRCATDRFSLVREKFVPFAGIRQRFGQRLPNLFRIEWNGKRSETKLSRLLFDFTPGLLGVISGKLSLVGVKARPTAAVEELPDDWRALYLKTKPGLVTEAEVVFGLVQTEDELFTAEAYYGAVESMSHDLKLLGRYLLQSSPHRADAVFERAKHVANHE